MFLSRVIAGSASLAATPVEPTAGRFAQKRSPGIGRGVFGSPFVLGTGFIVTAVLLPLPAVAGVSNLEFVQAESNSDSSSTKSVSVPCQRNKVALSGGAYVNSLNGVVSGRVHIDAIVPYTIGIGFVEATASEWADGADDAWSLIVFGICGDPPRGFEIVTGYSATDSNSVHSAIAECSNGKELVGFGGRASTASGYRVALTAIFPAAKRDRVLVQAYEEESGEASNWTTEAIAVCASPIAGMYVVPTSSANDSEEGKFISGDCSGDTLHGFGFAFFGRGKVFLTGVWTDEALQLGNAIAVEDGNGYANPWHMIGHALCG